jgi:hypothetical protein
MQEINQIVNKWNGERRKMTTEGKEAKLKGNELEYWGPEWMH